AVVVIQSGDDDTRPEPRAILAYAPAFVLGAAMFARHREFRLRFPGAAIVGLVEHGGMPAENFHALVARDAARAGVPAGDDAFRAEHVDRVVLHALDDQAKAFLAFTQDLFLLLAIGEVTRDL